MSPPVSCRSWPRYSTPACTLSAAELALRGDTARLLLIHDQVPGRICITPRALALDTRSLLKPLSCQPIALASDDGTPWAAAISEIVVELTRSGVGYGGALGTTVFDGAGDDELTLAPVGSLSTVPIRSGLLGSTPFMFATAIIGTPLRAAIAVSESPGRTV